MEVPCPYCDYPLPVDVSRVGGDLVPYGSMWVRTPAGWSVEMEDICLECGAHLSDDDLCRLKEKVAEEMDAAWHAGEDV